MQYIKFQGGNNYCGCDYTKYIAFPIKKTVDELSEISEEFANENAEGYEYIATQGLDKDDFETTEDYEEAYTEVIEGYYEDITSSWEEVTEEEWAENDGEIMED
jgi:hypothetical protein